jgi:hypothetical protein
MGCIALALLLVAEFTLVRLVRGISIREYLVTRDRISGAAYYAMPVVLALMTLLVAQVARFGSVKYEFRQQTHPRPS